MATDEQLALARKIAIDLWPGEDVEYRSERRAAQEAALAAIIETTELAAKMIDRHYDSGDRDTHYERMIATDLRSGAHIRGRGDEQAD